MNKQLLIVAFISNMILILTGCSSLNSQLDCPRKPGVVCKSLDEVNAMVDQGKLSGSFVSDVSQGTTSLPDTHLTSHHLLRSKETVARIWIAPFEDRDGDYYASTMLYRVIKPSHWLDHPIKEVDDESEVA